jgi:hypothetical protein
MFVSAIQQLLTPSGTLTFNGASVPRLLVLGVPGFDNHELRTAVDPRPQLGGLIVHRALEGGRYPGIKVLLQGSDASSVAAYEDEIKGKVGSILETQGRVIFQPPGKEQRFLEVNAYEQIEFDPVDSGAFGEPVGFLKTGLIPLVTSDPYAFTYTQDVNDILNGGSLVISNLGNAPSLPVLRVYGPFTAFTITNTTTGEQIRMGNTNPMNITSGHYVEIVNKWESCVLDGNVKHIEGYLDVATTDFWALQPNPTAPAGANTISASFVGAGGTTKVTVLSNSAWR